MNDKGNIFLELRREAGYTQKSLAEALNVTDKAISKWERGICLPDVTLMKKLSLLLDADIELFLGNSENLHSNNWVGFIDFEESEFDLSKTLYDKPAVYYILSHFFLLGITNIYFRGSESNKKFLLSPEFLTLGFNFIFDFKELPNTNIMIIDKPVFLFGSDLTHLFQGAMVSECITKACLYGLPTSFLFCPSEYSFMYLKNPKYLYEIAAKKNFGRGMVCVEMGNPDSDIDISNFIKMYQNNSGFLIGSLEEIAYNKNVIDKETLFKLVENKSYKSMLINNMNLKSKP